MRRAVLLVLLLPLVGCTPTIDPQTQASMDNLARLKAQVQGVEQSIAAARSEREQLDDQLRGAMERLSDKLRRRVNSRDQLYIELQTDRVGDLVRAFLEGHTRTGTQAGRPYEIKLKGVHTRSHRDRIFLSASYEVSYGGSRCEGPTSGYIIHLDREYLKLRDLAVSCKTPTGAMSLKLGELIEPLPLPLTLARASDLTSTAGAKLPASRLEMVTPLQAQITPERLYLRASTVSLKGVAR